MIMHIYTWRCPGFIPGVISMVLSELRTDAMEKMDDGNERA